MSEIAFKRMRPTGIARVVRPAALALMYPLFAVGCLALSASVPLVALVRRGPARRPALRRVTHWAARLWLKILDGLGLAHYHLHGPWPAEGGTLLLANHPTLIDVLFVLGHEPDLTCVVKADLLRVPFVRLLIRQLGYVSNDNPELMLNEACDRLQRGERVLLFPEATRTVPGRPPQFRLGAAELALRAGARIQPVVIGTDHPYLSKGHRWYNFPQAALRYHVHFPAPLAANNFAQGPGAVERRHARRVLTRRLEQLFCATLGVSYKGGDSLTTQAEESGLWT